jgi:hypothetical protein
MEADIMFRSTEYTTHHDPLRHWRKGWKKDNILSMSLIYFAAKFFLQSSKLTIIIYTFQSMLSEANYIANSK